MLEGDLYESFTDGNLHGNLLLQPVNAPASLGLGPHQRVITA